MIMADFIERLRDRRMMGSGLLLISASLAVATTVLSVASLSRERVTVLVPPTLGAATEIWKDGASRDYFRAWGLFVAQSVGNVTPSNVQFVLGAIQPLLAASIHNDVVARIEEEIDKIKRDRLTTSFEPQRVTVEEDRRRVFVTGMRVANDLLGGELREVVTYEVGIAVLNHRPVIEAINAYPGEPRTAEVLRRREETGGEDAL